MIVLLLDVFVLFVLNCPFLQINCDKILLCTLKFAQKQKHQYHPEATNACLVGMRRLNLLKLKQTFGFHYGCPLVNNKIQIYIGLCATPEISTITPFGD